MLLQRTIGGFGSNETACENPQHLQVVPNVMAKVPPSPVAETSPVQPNPILPSAEVLQTTAHRALAMRRQRPNDEMAQRRALVEQQREAFMGGALQADTLDRIAALVSRLAADGALTAEVFRFPSEYCTDRGRALNNEDSDWPSTLQGLARAHFDLLHRSFTPLGLRIGAQIVTWPMLMPGDAALILSWRE